MRDRVGELLAERARVGGGAGGGIALSILLHGSIAAAVVYAAMHATAPQQVSTLSIRFAPTPAIQEPVTAKPTASHLASHTSKTQDSRTGRRSSKPRRETDSEERPFSPFGQSTKKGSDKPLRSSPTPHPPPRTIHSAVGTIDIPVGATGVTGLDADFPYTIYIERMKSLIGQHWLRPQVGNGTVAVVSFTIDRDGTIRDAKNEISSGNGTFDPRSPPCSSRSLATSALPFAYNGTYLGVHLTFR